MKKQKSKKTNFLKKWESYSSPRWWTKDEKMDYDPEAPAWVKIIELPPGFSIEGSDSNKIPVFDYGFYLEQQGSPEENPPTPLWELLKIADEVQNTRIGEGCALYLGD